MGAHIRLLSESYSMNTYMTRLSCCFSKYLCNCDFDESSLSIGRVNTYNAYVVWYGTYVKGIDAVLAGIISQNAEW